MSVIYDISSLSKMFQCSERHIYDLISEDKLRAKKVGKKYWVKEEWLNAYLDSDDKPEVMLRAIK